MRFKNRTTLAKFNEECEKMETWHRWFAWYPVRLNDKEIIWLEIVERKGEFHNSNYGYFWDFQYRQLGDS